MNKQEIVEFLKPFTDEIEIEMVDPLEGARITHDIVLNYSMVSGTGKIFIAAIGKAKENY